MPQLKRRRLGYNIQKERLRELQTFGAEPRELMAKFQDQYPEDNAVTYPGIFPILDQGRQGACQGHSLASIFTVCYFRATGRVKRFSRAAAYYLSQRKDGIRGDQGSTLSGGNWVATTHGLCPEEAWRYPVNYNPIEPPGVKYEFKLNVSKPITDLQTALDWLDLGLPLQNGMTWGASCEREVVNNYVASGGGGHSTYWAYRKPNGNCYMLNSWSENWNSDGINEWHPDSIKAVINSRWGVVIGYSPDQMLFPPPEPIG